MSGPSKASVRKQLAGMVAAFQPGAQDATGQAGLQGNYLRSAMGWGMDPALGAALPRDPRVFMSMLGPGEPMVPSVLDPRGPGGRPLPRLNQSPLNWNLPTAPGTYKMVPFKLMRNLADMSTVARDCIRIRATEVADVDWEIAPKEEEKGEFRVFPEKKAGLFDQWRDQRKALQKFMERPDPVRGLRYDAWIRMAVEAMLVTDALSIFEHPTWGPGAGVLGSDLFALTIIDGTTVKPLLDIRGGPPAPPNPAYQQFLWGLPRVDLVALLLDPRDDPAIQDAQRGLDFSDSEYLELTRDQLAYLPFHKRDWTTYGFSNIEQAITFINLALKREQKNLAYFTDGDIPEMLLMAPESWTLEQMNRYEAQWHAKLAGDQGWKSRVNMIPAGLKPEQLKPAIFDITFDEYVDRVICSAFDVDPTEVGFEPRGGLGGTGYMEGQDDRRKRLTVGPLVREFKGYFDDVFARRAGVDMLELRYDDLDPDDEEVQHKIDSDRLTKATLSMNEYRRRRGEPPIDDPNADKYWFILGREVLPLDTADQPAAIAAENPAQQQLDAVTGKPVATPPGGKPSDDEPPAGAAQKSVVDELDAFERYLRKGRARRFTPDLLPKAAVDAVYRKLAAGDDRKTVFTTLRKDVLEGQEMLAAEVADALLDRLTAAPAG